MHDCVGQLVAEKRVGVARAKRRDLTAAETAAALTRARAALAAAGLAAAAEITPLAVTDLTQTYRVRRGSDSAVLKLLPPSMAASALEAQVWLGTRGVDLPAVHWADVTGGAILYEDLGSEGLSAVPNRDQLADAVVYLARLHAAGIVEAEAASGWMPATAGRDWPTPATFAARLLTQVRAATRPAERVLLDIAATLALWIGNRPRIIIGDLKREHLRLRAGSPVLTDLELVSAWDVPPSNLATLLAFPGQFQPAIDETLRRWLLARYADEHDRLEGTKTDVGDLDRAVRHAEMLIAISFAGVDDFEAGGSSGESSGNRDRRMRLPDMVRNRRLLAGSSGMLSIEYELGPELFELLRDRLNAAGRLRILDLGCGDGQALGEIANHWPRHRIVGLDRYLEARNGRRIAADAASLPITDASLDLVYGVQVLQYVPDKLACLSEVHRVLAPGGLGLFAMSEHFEGGSAFVPPLPDLVQSWAGAVRGITERRLGGRRVLAFAISRTPGQLDAGHRLVEVQRCDRDPSDVLPYVRSVYRRASQAANVSPAT
jgi:SAM-dependent methyltransferase